MVHDVSHSRKAVANMTKDTASRKSVRLKKQRDGSFRANWYGQYQDGKKHCEVNLNIPWRGVAPESGKSGDPGDADFEASRIEARGALAAHVAEVQHKGRADHLTERLIESKTGKSVQYCRIAELPALYRQRAKRNNASEDHLKRNCDPVFNRFISLMIASNFY